MIHLEYKDGNYYVNGKKVDDELTLPMPQRVVLRSFKKSIEKGLKIKSTLLKIKEN